jgi:hypothetical protein
MIIISNLYIMWYKTKQLCDNIMVINLNLFNTKAGMNLMITHKLVGGTEKHVNDLCLFSSCLEITG